MIAMAAAEKLSDKLERLGCFRTLHVREAFRAVPREAFASDALAEDAHRNAPLPLPSGGTLTHPYIFAFILDQLYLRKGNRVLLVDGGSGWEASLVAALVCPEAEGAMPRRQLVFALEPSEEAKSYASEKARAAGASGGIVFFTEEKLAASQGPFERIASVRKVSPETLSAWKEMLSIGGRIVAPQGESIVVLQKDGPDDFEEKKFFGFHFAD